MTPFYHYFFVKVGYGNSLLRPLLSYFMKAQYLWFGYPQVPHEEALKGLDFNNKRIKSSVKDNWKNLLSSWQSRDDLARLYAFGHLDREMTRLFTYDEEFIYFFKPRDQIIPASDPVMQDFFNLGLTDDDRKNVGGAFEQKGENLAAHLTGGRFLPVTLIAKFSRAGLLPGINSLSVYQYFNRGAFRPLWSADSGKSKALTEVMALDALNNSINGAYSSTETEAAYGRMLRCYFDCLLSKEKIRIFSESLRPLLKSGKQNSTQIHFLTMSPSQLELLGAMILIDRGFAIDVGYAGSLDHIDVRGRLSHTPSENEVSILIEDFQTLGLPIKPKARDLLLETGVLQIQCKNYDHGTTLSRQLSPTIFLQYGTSPDIWSLKAISEVLVNSPELISKKFPNMWRWNLNLLRYFKDEIPESE